VSPREPDWFGLVWFGLSLSSCGCRGGTSDEVNYKAGKSVGQDAYDRQRPGLARVYPLMIKSAAASYYALDMGKSTPFAAARAKGVQPGTKVNKQKHKVDQAKGHGIPLAMR
jgi:hypothetical protein